MKSSDDMCTSKYGGIKSMYSTVIVGNYEDGTPKYCIGDQIFISDSDDNCVYNGDTVISIWNDEIPTKVFLDSDTGKLAVNTYHCFYLLEDYYPFYKQMKEKCLK